MDSEQSYFAKSLFLQGDSALLSQCARRLNTRADYRILYDMYLDNRV